ncbi:MAG TPA: O-antigen ligase family protein, partial [Nitrospirota bacterium]|nr:O-antigen ligase family protein [Nitrospirota bacterium]
LTGTLPSATDLAAVVMTSALLCTLFATSYMYGKKRDLIWWSALAGIPVIGLTRMGMIASALSLPLTFAPMRLLKRVVLVTAIIAAGYSLFHTERMQQKMFYSGSGTFQDVRRDNPDFATSGRNFIWERIEAEIGKQPWLGYGANASERFVSRLTGGIAHPHNDWLRLLYDYGYLGTSVFGICLLMQMWDLLKRARDVAGENRILFNAGATSFIVFVLFMFTDNIILYVAFFGNLQFTVLGLAYAAQHASIEQDGREAEPRRRPWWAKVRW